MNVNKFEFVLCMLYCMNDFNDNEVLDVQHNVLSHIIGGSNPLLTSSS